MNTRNDDTRKDANRDPITGTPGAHPVGTGAGAAAGGAAGGAIGAVGGPIGAAAGVVIGAVAGGLAGKGIAEHIDPTAEDAYWREHHTEQPYAKGSSYDDWRRGYELGYTSYGKYGASGKRYEDIESELEREYNQNPNRSRLSWDKARLATRAAWERLDRNAHRDLHRLVDYDVVDNADEKIGTVDCIWEDTTGQPAFLGVKTGWLGMGKTHVFPAESARVNHRGRRVQLPFRKEVVQEAPTFDAEAEIDQMTENQIRDYYQSHGISIRHSHWGTAQTAQTGQTAQTSQVPSGSGSRQTNVTEGERTVALHEESIKVGKREVESGGVRLRKIVRTETVNQPVELSREEFVIERVPASGRGATSAEFNEEDIYIPLRREEPVVEKEVHVREEVVVGKKRETERRDVSGQVRKEDIEVTRDQDRNKNR